MPNGVDFVAIDGGDYHMVGLAVPPEGACCIPFSGGGIYCLEMPQHLCESDDGYWYGASVACGDPGIECEQIPNDSACCIEDPDGWMCVDLDLVHCDESEGVWYPGLFCGNPDVSCSQEHEDPCPSDFDGDGAVNIDDLLFLIGAWGTPTGDVDGDGGTSIDDLLTLLDDFGECPE